MFWPGGMRGAIKLKAGAAPGEKNGLAASEFSNAESCPTTSSSSPSLGSFCSSKRDNIFEWQ